MMAAMMNRSRSLYAVCLTAVMFLFTFGVKAEELTKFERVLDRVENSFWRALFAPETSETRKMFQRYTGELLQCAQYIKKLQQMNGNVRSYGDLTGGSSKLTQIIISHSAFRKKRAWEDARLCLPLSCYTRERI